MLCVQFCMNVRAVLLSYQQLFISKTWSLHDLSDFEHSFTSCATVEVNSNSHIRPTSFRCNSSISNVLYSFEMLFLERFPIAKMIFKLSSKV